MSIFDCYCINDPSHLAFVLLILMVVAHCYKSSIALQIQLFLGYVRSTWRSEEHGTLTGGLESVHHSQMRLKNRKCMQHHVLFWEEWIYYHLIHDCRIVRC